MEAEIKNQLQMTEEELFFKLGNDNSSGAINFDPIEKGREIFENLKIRYQNTICSNEALKHNFKDGDRFDKINLVSTLIDLIATTKIPVSPITFCILLIKEGLDSYCKIDWYEVHENNKR